MAKTITSRHRTTNSAARLPFFKVDPLFQSHIFAVGVIWSRRPLKLYLPFSIITKQFYYNFVNLSMSCDELVYGIVILFGVFFIFLGFFRFILPLCELQALARNKAGEHRVAVVGLDRDASAHLCDRLVDDEQTHALPRLLGGKARLKDLRPQLFGNRRPVVSDRE